MANYCEVCGKGTATGFNVSHSHLKTKRTWKPNIQRVRVLVDGQVKIDHLIAAFQAGCISAGSFCMLF